MPKYEQSLDDPPLVASSALLLNGEGHRERVDVNIHQHVGPCLFVSREFGSGGGQIARRVSQRLGWNLLDKEILGVLASDYDTPPVVLDVVDEKKVDWLTDLFNGWIEGHGFSQLSFVHRLSHLFNMAAKRGNVVIVGRGARFLIPANAGLSVRVIAPFEFRVEQIMLHLGLSNTKARKLVEQSDYERQAFVERYFNQHISDPHIHDVVINVENLGQNDAVDLIVDAVDSWARRSRVGKQK
jgi:cytidylate kinase